MFSIAEISKTFITDNFTPLTSWVYSKQITLTQAEIDSSYWVAWGGTIDYNQENKAISSVYLDFILNLAEMDTLVDCQGQEESFYFDSANQILYIHVTHTENPFAQTIETGLLFGYCSDKVRYFGNQEYKPILLNIPTISQSADPLQYDIMAFSGGSVVLSNDGEFDTFEKLYGNTIRLKIGKDGDDYTDLITIFSGYIKDYTTTTKDITIDIGDNREKLQIEYPTQVFDTLSGLAEDSNGTIIPDGYGTVIQVPAYPILDGSGTVTFQWGVEVTSITQVYVEQDDKISAVAHGDFSTDGTFTLNDAEAYIDGDNTKGLRKVYVTGVMRNLTNPADIIVDLNARLANIQYNSTNYNLTEWEAEKVDLADVSLYMDDSKSLYDWISLLQSGSTWGFRYEDSGKRTIRRDDPDRATITFDDGTTLITPVEIRNSDIPIDQNAELYATSCIVKYGYNHRTQSYAQVENTDYKDAVLQEHRIEKILTIESLLTSKTDAEAKALRIMQDQSKVRPIITLELEVSKYTTPRIYDMIEAQVSLLTRESKIPSVWTYVLGDMDILGDDLGLIGEVHKLTRTEAYTKNGSRLYFGELKGQIIGIEPRTDTDSVVLRIREREMGTPLYNTDIIPLTSRPTLTVMDDGDYFAILDTTTGKISKILRTDVQKALNISYDNATSGLTATQVQAALDELVVNLGSSDNAISALGGRLDTLESDDETEGSVAKTVKDAVEPIIDDVSDHEYRLDSTELTLARQGQDLASVKQTLQQGNGATLDFEDIGIVPLDARATGRANPTIEGLTATNLLGTDGGFEVDSNSDGIADGLIVYQDALCTYSLDTDVSLTGKSQKIVTTSYSNIGFLKNTVIGHVYLAVAWIKSNSIAGLRIRCTNNGIDGGSPDYADIVSDDTWRKYTMYFTAKAPTILFNLYHFTGGVGTIYLDNWYFIDLTSIYGSGNEPSEADCAKIFSYFDGTKSIQLPARIISKSEDESESSTLYIADNEEVRSFGATTDLVKVVNGEFVLEKNVNDDATAVISPPIITPLLTSGILQAKPKGTVYFEPYYEGSHQTNASSEITLPYEGTIDKLTGYDENLEPYEVPSTGYTLVGTTLTITDALENEVWFVKMSRSEPLAPEMSVNVINNKEVIADTTNGKFYKLVPTITNGVLVSQTPTEVV